jgi:hypothetical protein
MAAAFILGSRCMNRGWTEDNSPLYMRYITLHLDIIGRYCTRQERDVCVHSVYVN